MPQLVWLCEVRAGYAGNAWRLLFGLAQQAALLWCFGHHAVNRRLPACQPACLPACAADSLAWPAALPLSLSRSVSGAGGMFSRMLGAACSMLRSLKDISERPDVADDTFLLAGRALNYAPRLLLTPQLLSALLDSALAGVLVQHREACCSILAFVMRLLDPATHRACAPEAVAHLQAALAPRASLLVRLVLAGVAGALPTNRLAELADVLHALLRVSAVLAGWLAGCGWCWVAGLVATQQTVGRGAHSGSARLQLVGLLALLSAVGLLLLCSAGDQPEWAAMGGRGAGGCSRRHCPLDGQAALHGGLPAGGC